MNGNIVFEIQTTGRLPGRRGRLLVTVLAAVLWIHMTHASGNPLTPEQAAARPGEVCTIAFQVETAARVTDITDKKNPQPLEVRLVDARNDDIHATPTERASVIVRIPASALRTFNAADMNELAQRYQNSQVLVTGKVEVEPHPLRHDATGENQLRPVITITSPDQIRIEKQMAQTRKL